MSIRRSSLLAVLLAFIIVPQAAAQAGPLARITVHSGDHPRVDQPVSAALEGIPLHLATATLELVETTGGMERATPAQLRPAHPHRRW